MDIAWKTDSSGRVLQLRYSYMPVRGLIILWTWQPICDYKEFYCKISMNEYIDQPWYESADPIRISQSDQHNSHSWIGLVQAPLWDWSFFHSECFKNSVKDMIEIRFSYKKESKTLKIEMFIMRLKFLFYFLLFLIALL